jgi:acyl dehydratase
MSVNLYWEDVEVGQDVVSWSRKTDFMHWNRYAAVNDEFVYIHMDDVAGRRALNEQGAFGMGNLRFAYLHNMLREWAGDEVQVRYHGQADRERRASGRYDRGCAESGRQVHCSR